MTMLILSLLTIALASSFLLVTRYEQRNNRRFFEVERAKLDRSIEQAIFLFNHVDFGSFLRSEARKFAELVLHLAVSATLQAVRTVEHTLTRAVRELRHRVERHDTPSIAAEPREFVKALSGFKRELATTRPIVPEIQ